jgi:hypothetical protein
MDSTDGDNVLRDSAGRCTAVLQEATDVLQDAMLRMEKGEEFESARADVVTVMLQAQDALEKLRDELASIRKDASVATRQQAPIFEQTR